MIDRDNVIDLLMLCIIGVLLWCGIVSAIAWIWGVVMTFIPC